MTNVSSLTHAISINPANGEQIGHYPFESAVGTGGVTVPCDYRVFHLA